jgi:hypothetical protein
MITTAVYWIVIPYSLIGGIDVSVECAASMPEDGGKMFLRNAGFAYRTALYHNSEVHSFMYWLFAYSATLYQLV